MEDQHNSGNHKPHLQSLEQVPIVYALRINKFVRRSANGRPYRPEIYGPRLNISRKPASERSRVCPRHRRADHIRQGAPLPSITVTEITPLTPRSTIAAERQRIMATSKPDPAQRPKYAWRTHPYAPASHFHSFDSEIATTPLWGAERLSTPRTITPAQDSGVISELLRQIEEKAREIQVLKQRLATEIAREGIAG